MLVVPRKLLFVDRSHSGTSNWHPQLMAFFQSLHQPSTCAILVVANLSNEKWSIWSVQSAYNHWILNLFQQTCVWTFKTSYNSSPSDWSIIIHSLLGPEDSGTPKPNSSHCHASKNTILKRNLTLWEGCRYGPNSIGGQAVPLNPTIPSNSSNHSGTSTESHMVTVWPDRICWLFSHLTTWLIFLLVILEHILFCRLKKVEILPCPLNRPLWVYPRDLLFPRKGKWSGECSAASTHTRINSS